MYCGYAQTTMTCKAGKAQAGRACLYSQTGPILYNLPTRGNEPVSVDPQWPEPGQPSMPKTDLQ